MVEFRRFDSVDSTNSAARPFPPGTVVIAQEQTAGRGRFGRKWDSGKGGIYLSIVIQADAGEARYLTIVAALAACRSLEKVCQVRARIKWPNDLLLEGRKLCGILTEAILEGKDARMIVGIGINTNNSIPPELGGTAVSLRGLGISADNEQVIRALVSEFETLRGAARSSILQEWRESSDTIGRKVRVVMRGREIAGIAEDIDQECNLIVRTGNGKEKVGEGDVYAV